MKNCPFFNFLLRKQLLSTVSTISDHQEVLRISWSILATSFPVSMMLSSDMWRWHWQSKSVSPKIHKSHFQYDLLNLGLILCTSLWLIDMSSVPLFFTTKSQKWPTSVRKPFRISCNDYGIRCTCFCISWCSPFRVSVHGMKMILPWNCTGSHFNSAIMFWISAGIPNVVNPEKFFHSNSIGSPSIRSKSLR